VVSARIALRVESSLVICNPIPSEHALDAETVEAAVESCEALATTEGVTGKALTPFLLSCVAERTGGRSLQSNLALLESNAALAAEVARALSVDH
jgi:pseudouridine-5'-phosphate glycosidase